MSKVLVSRCPFKKEGSASRAIFLYLAKAKRPLKPIEVAEATNLPIGQVKNLMLSYRGRFHGAPLQRSGVRIELCEKGYSLATCKPDAEAKRPPRGLKPKKAKKEKKPAKRTTKHPKSKVSRKKKPTPVAPVKQEPALDAPEAPTSGVPDESEQADA